MSVVVVHHGGDPLATAVAAELRNRGRGVVEIEADELGDRPVTLNGDLFVVDGLEVRGLLFRASTRGPFGKGFVKGDRAFVSAETSAVWLAAAHLPSVTSLNRLDAESWCQGNRWIIWRRFLMRLGIQVAPVVYGAKSRGDAALQWLTHEGSFNPTVPDPLVRASLLTPLAESPSVSRPLLVCGSPLHDCEHPGLDRAAKLLAESGINLASAIVDRYGRVVALDGLPKIAQADLDAVCTRVVAFYEAHLPLGQS